MIKQPWLLVISGIALAVFLFFVVERLTFLASAQRSVGKVMSVSGRNSRCGSKNSYDCTKFTAEVTFPLEDGSSGYLSISAGSKRGYNQPTTYASRHVGASVKVVHSPDGTKAYEDTLFGVWATPIITLFIQLSSLVGSMTEPKRRYRT